jgi:hypothetical protein
LDSSGEWEEAITPETRNVRTLSPNIPEGIPWLGGLAIRVPATALFGLTVEAAAAELLAFAGPSDERPD